MYKVYLWTNTINNKKYVGTTKQKSLEARAGRQGEGYRGSPRFYNAIRKYGFQNFKGQILADNLDKEQASLLEKHYIDKYASMNPQFGYNLHQGGFPQRQFSDQDRCKRISDTLKKQRGNAQYRDIMRSRSLKMWSDPKKRQTILKKRAGKYAGKPRIRTYCLQTSQILQDLGKLAAFVGKHKSSVSLILKKAKQTNKPVVIKNKEGKPYTFVVYDPASCTK